MPNYLTVNAHRKQSLDDFKKRSLKNKNIKIALGKVSTMEKTVAIGNEKWSNILFKIPELNRKLSHESRTKKRKNNII